jgi:hypothetical protein
MNAGPHSRDWAHEISSEQELVLCLARLQIDDGAKDRIRGLTSSEQNWGEVVRIASEQHLSAVLLESLSAEQSLEQLGSYKQVVSDAVRESARYALGLTGEMVRLYQLFTAAQVPAIPYKGPVLAMLAYGNFVERHYVDLDFALRQQFVPRAVETLRAAGYRALFDPQEAHSGERAFTPGQYSFEAHDRKVMVELHTERTLRYFPTRLDFQDLESRLIEVEIAGTSLRTFSIEDTLVMLCVHGAKHFWDRLAWIFDVAKLITVQDVDWIFLQQIAAKVRSTRVVLLGLALAHDLFGASLPDFLVEKIRKDSRVLNLAQKVCGQYAGISKPGVGVWSRAAFRLGSSDGIMGGLRHMLRLALSPTESDRGTIHLPGFLVPLYVFVRPWRLLREYGIVSKRWR